MGDQSKQLCMETILETVGHDGRYQQLLFWLFLVPTNFLIPWFAMAPLFFIMAPDHWCNAPGKPADVDLELWKNLTVPREVKAADKFNQCMQYNVTWDDIEALSLLHGNATQLLPNIISNSFNSSECQSGWLYDHSDFDATLSQQEDWVCSDSDQVALWMTVGGAGNVVGTLIFSSVSDLYGRSAVYSVISVIAATFGIIRLQVKTYLAIFASHFIAASTMPALLELSIIIVVEQVSLQWRANVSTASFVAWTFGSSLLPLIAYFARSWTTLGIITASPFVIFSICWWVLPDSLQWLVSRGQVDNAKKLLRKIATINNRKVPEDIDKMVELVAEKESTVTNYGLLQLFSRSLLRKRTFFLTACYAGNMIFYYALVYNISYMSGNVFLNFFFVAFIELPSNFVGWWAVENFGRRWTQSASFLLASIFLALAIFFIDDNPWINTTLLSLSKLFITISFLVIYIQCSEIYPTTHRACGMGLSSLTSNICRMSVPYIVYLSVYWAGLHYVIVCTIGLISCFVSTFLPETFGANLPQTLEEANDFKRTEPFWSYKGKRFFAAMNRNEEKKQSSINYGYEAHPDG